MVDDGVVAVNGRAVTTRSRRLAEGEVVTISGSPPQPLAIEADTTVPVDAIFADDDVVVVNKPAGLVVHPGAGHAVGTLAHGLVARFPELASVGDPSRPGIVHRLDAGTSGLLVVARNDAAHKALVTQLAARQVTRRYIVLVVGHVETDAGLVDAPIGRSARDPTRMAVSAGGRAARTRYEVIARFDRPIGCSLLTCELETGRTHQIRVHLAAIGHPVAGDDRYGGRRAVFGLTRPFLHAAELGFDHPRTGEAAHFTAPLPGDLESIRAGLA